MPLFFGSGAEASKSAIVKPISAQRQRACARVGHASWIDASPRLPSLVSAGTRRDDSAQSEPLCDGAISMNSNLQRLRNRFLLGLTATGALAHAACGSTTRDEGTGATGGGGSAAGGAGGSVSSGGSFATGGTSATGGTTASGGTAGAAPLCDYGKPATSCYTLAQLEYMRNNPPFGGDQPADGGMDGGPIVLDECPEAELVQDDCCNSAAAGPVEQGELCCYTFCEGACCGRAFVVNGQQRLAPVVPRTDWLGEYEVARADLVNMATPTRSALARAWLNDARMEHASIASFAKFTLELLSFGAPPDLVADAQASALDEVDHARRCFALASRYSGCAEGPGALNVGASVGELYTSATLADAAVATLREGCLGETLAAVLARAQLEAATDPRVRETLTRIAQDEERHAELAWRFLKWAVAAGGEAVERSLRSAVAELNPGGSDLGEVRADVEADPAWREHGRLTQADMRRLEGDVLREIIVPCVHALLASSDEPEARQGLVGSGLTSEV